MIVIANLVVLFTKASASAARINEVLETMPSIVETAEKPVNVPLKADTPKVEFQNVSFAYAGSRSAGEKPSASSAEQVRENLL